MVREVFRERQGASLHDRAWQTVPLDSGTTSRRSIVWGRQVYRWSDLDFEANLRDGIAIDWPIRYADVAPWYDYVEDFIGITGEALGLPQLPDSKFLPPMELNCAESVVKDAIAKHFGPDRVLTIGRAAVLTQGHRDRAACHYSGPCERRCITRSYFSSVNATLPAAEKTGRMVLARARRTECESSTPKLARRRSFVPRRFSYAHPHWNPYASCSTLLLRNFPTDWRMGHNLMDHVTAGGAYATIPGNEDKTVLGRRPNGIYVPRFRNVKTKSAGFLRGYGFQGGAHREGWERD